MNETERETLNHVSSVLEDVIAQLKQIREELWSARDRANPRSPKVAEKTDSGSAFDPENR